MYNIAMDTVFSTREAADRLGLSADHIRRLLEQGHLKGKKLGRDWVVLRLNYDRKRKPKEGKK